MARKPIVQTEYDLAQIENWQGTEFQVVIANDGNVYLVAFRPGKEVRIPFRPDEALQIAALLAQGAQQQKSADLQRKLLAG